MSVRIQLNDDVFPKNLNDLRRKRKLSQLSLARLVGISVHDLRGIERGRLSSQLRLAEYMKLCKVLHVCPTAMGTVLLSSESNSE